MHGRDVQRDHDGLLGNLDGMTGPKEYMKFGAGRRCERTPTQTNSISHGSPWILIRKMIGRRGIRLTITSS